MGKVRATEFSEYVVILALLINQFQKIICSRLRLSPIRNTSYLLPPGSPVCLPFLSYSFRIVKGSTYGNGVGASGEFQGVFILFPHLKCYVGDHIFSCYNNKPVVAQPNTSPACSFVFIHNKRWKNPDLGYITIT